MGKFKMTFAEARQHFKYYDGELYWRKPTSRCVRVNAKAGNVYDNYEFLRFKGKSYPTHKVIFLYFNGYKPRFIDHIDRNKTNNNIENLRECTKSQNEANTGHRKTNKLKEKHICINWGWYRVRIDRHEKRIEGSFKTIEEAITFRDNALKEVDKEFYYKGNEQLCQ
jgi:hypothetical protein